MAGKGRFITMFHEAGFQKLSRNSGSSYFLSIPALWVFAKVHPVKGEYWVNVSISDDGDSLVIKGLSIKHLAFIQPLEGEKS